MLLYSGCVLKTNKFIHIDNRNPTHHNINKSKNLIYINELSYAGIVSKYQDSIKCNVNYYCLTKKIPIYSTRR